MAEITVNKLLSMKTALTNRRNELNSVKTMTTSRSISRQTRPDGTKDEQINEPTYDIKTLDRMSNRINNALFEIDQSIKASNAITKVTVDINFSELMADLQ